MPENSVIFSRDSREPFPAPMIPSVAETEAIAPELDKYRVKGTTFRAYVEYLEKSGMLDHVLPQLSPEAARLVANRPLPGGWVGGRLLDEFCAAVYALDGKEGIVKMQRAILGGP